jgi:hypothetical protein
MLGGLAHYVPRQGMLDHGINSVGALSYAREGCK